MRPTYTELLKDLRTRHLIARVLNALLVLGSVIMRRHTPPAVYITV